MGRKVIYWIATALLALELVLGGVWDVLRVPQVHVVIDRLGYPAYFLVILGIWKLLGAVAITVPRFPRLKEWAYAGVVFDLTGALVSNVVSGITDAGTLAYLVLMMGVTAASWALRPAGRRNFQGSDVTSRGGPMSCAANANKLKKLILAIALTSWPTWVVAQSYSTSFPLTENPISEKGKWVGGQSASGNLWGDVQTSGGMAYGVSEPTTYGDPTAILTGSWAADQQAQVTAKIVTTPTECCHEIEVRLRVTISANRITGYEVYCSVVPQNKYCHIARWSGPNGLYCNIEPSSPSINLVNGDVLMGKVTGSNPAVITGYVNGVQIMRVSDTGNEGGEGTDCRAGRPVFTSGSPGIGFYDDKNDNQWHDFGISNFTASAE